MNATIERDGTREIKRFGLGGGKWWKDAIKGAKSGGRRIGVSETRRRVFKKSRRGREKKEEEEEEGNKAPGPQKRRI